MPSDSDIDHVLRDHVLRTLSARLSVIEMAIAALAPKEAAERARALETFDRAATGLIDQYVAMPVDEAYLELVRCSVDDLRNILASDECKRDRFV
jgi:hypothetical protein